MATYFTKKDPEVRWLIEQCIEGFDTEVARDYLVSLLSSKWVAEKPPKEIFQTELNAKMGFEQELKK